MQRPLLLLALLLCTRISFGQCDSTFFRTTGTLIFDVVLLDTSTIIGAGDNGYIIKSTDGGKSWRNIPTFQPRYLRAIYAVTDRVLYAVGSWKTILKSEDGGESWYPLLAHTTNLSSNATDTYYDVFFQTADKGFIVGDNSILYSTTDGGRSWKDTTFSTGNTARLNCVTFVNDTLGFLSGGGSALFRTRDGGKTWENINIDFVGFNKIITKVAFVDAFTGFAVGQDGICIKTTDGGSTWTKINTPTSGFYYDICFLDAQTGFIGGIYSSGIVLKTTNGGVTWSYEPSGFGLMSSCYTAATDPGRRKVVFAGGGSQGDFLGYNGRSMVTTSDRGATYRSLSGNGYLAYNDMFFLNDSTGYIAGEMGGAFKTSDRGESWKPLKTIPALLGGNPARAIFFIDQQNGYASSDRIYRTADGGTSWQQTTVPEDQTQVFGKRMHFTDPQSGLVMDNYALFRTGDGGATWATVLRSQNVLSDFCLTAGGKGFAVGYGGKFFTSFNGGADWTASSLSTSESLTAVYFYDNNLGFVGTSDTTLYKTVDGGASWTRLHTRIRSVAMRSFLFLSRDTGYMAVSNEGPGAIYKTEDGGLTWVVQKGGSEKISRLAGVRTVYAAGSSGLIYKTDKLHAPGIPGYIYGPQLNCQNGKSVFVTGTMQDVSYQWSLSGGGAQSFKQNLDTVLWNADGTYQLSVRVANACGTGPARETAVLVHKATTIAMQPSAQTVCAGTATTFSVSADGASVNYQWNKRGVPIAGANGAAYIIPKVTAGDAATYTVTVTGLCGSLTSAPAALIVLSADSCTTGVSMVNPSVESVSLTPNPVRERAVIRVVTRKSSSAHWIVTDGSGRVLQRFTGQLHAGENKLEVYVGHLSAGIYRVSGTIAGLPVQGLEFLKL